MDVQKGAILSFLAYTRDETVALQPLAVQGFRATKVRTSKKRRQSLSETRENTGVHFCPFAVRIPDNRFPKSRFLTNESSKKSRFFFLPIHRIPSCIKPTSWEVFTTSYILAYLAYPPAILSALFQRQRCSVLSQYARFAFRHMFFNVS